MGQDGNSPDDCTKCQDHSRVCGDQGIEAQVGELLEGSGVDAGQGWCRTKAGSQGNEEKCGNLQVGRGGDVIENPTEAEDGD